VTYCTLTDVEWANAVHVCRRVKFDLNILNKFGPETTPDDFPDLDILDTPELNNFDDVDYAGQDDELARGTVISQKRDARGSPIGNANTNANPIMDLRVYHVAFDDGDVCELTANIIAESMYASCDADGNEYILVDSFVDYKRNSKAVTKDNQRIVHNAATHFADPLLDGICVSSGRMDQPPGNPSGI